MSEVKQLPNNTTVALIETDILSFILVKPVDAPPRQYWYVDHKCALREFGTLRFEDQEPAGWVYKA